MAETAEKTWKEEGEVWERERTGINDELLEDDDRKVFVSMLPRTWTAIELGKAFADAFGEVDSAVVNWDDDLDTSKRFGFVTFKFKKGKNDAIAAAVLQPPKEEDSLFEYKNKIKIRPVEREGRDSGRGRDIGVCYQWTKGACKWGAACKFAHEGEGAVLEPKKPGTGDSKKMKCWAFKKGKCKLGDACPNKHPVAWAAKVEAAKGPKACRDFAQGTCKYGDKCKFVHPGQGSGIKAAHEGTGGKAQKGGDADEQSEQEKKEKKREKNKRKKANKKKNKAEKDGDEEEQQDQQEKTEKTEKKPKKKKNKKAKENGVEGEQEEQQEKTEKAEKKTKKKKAKTAKDDTAESPEKKKKKRKKDSTKDSDTAEDGAAEKKKPKKKKKKAAA
jgi:hypothetical protein